MKDFVQNIIIFCIRINKFVYNENKTHLSQQCLSILKNSQKAEHLNDILELELNIHIENLYLYIVSLLKKCDTGSQNPSTHRGLDSKSY